MSAAMNGHSRVVPSHQASRTLGGSFTTSPWPMSIHSTPPLDVGARPGHLAGQALAGEGAARGREVERRLPVRVDALQRVGIVVEGVRAARAGVEQHPEEAALVHGAPAHVVEHHRLVQALLLEQALHQLHGDDVALVGLGGAGDGVAVRLGATGRVEEALGEVGGRAQRDEAELVLPADAVGLELVARSSTAR